MVSLHEHLMSTYEEEAQKERFQITDDSQANWAMRCIGDARKDFNNAQEMYDKEKARLDDWLDKQREYMENREAYFTGLLTEYYMGRYQEEGRQTFVLPTGKFSIRKQQPLYERDEKALLEWAKENGQADIIKVKESLAWSDLKKKTTAVGNQLVLKDTGEVVPHVTVIERGLQCQAYPEV